MKKLEVDNEKEICPLLIYSFNIIVRFRSTSIILPKVISFDTAM